MAVQEGSVLIEHIFNVFMSVSVCIVAFQSHSIFFIKCFAQIRGFFVTLNALKSVDFSLESNVQLKCYFKCLFTAKFSLF